MQKLKLVQKCLLLLLMHCLLSDLFALSPENKVLRMQYLILHIVYDPKVDGPEAGRDTVFRFFSYYPDGALRAIKDSSVSDWRVTYSAEYDSTGKIRRLSEYGSELLYSVDYFWEKDNRIKYVKQQNGANRKDSGTIKYYGELRAVDLPENNPLAPENFLIVRADSTQYLGSDGKIITTWYWDYDSLGRCIKWRSRTPDSAIQWVEEYTYGYLRGLPARYPALEGETVVYVYNEVAARKMYDARPTGRQHHKDKVFLGNLFLLNGRKIGADRGDAVKKVGASLMVIVNEKSDEKLQMILSGNKKRN